jgi:hypothetical protein
MWSDNETTNDLFGFRVHAELLKELILDPKVLPVTIGVFGDWGGGKSSIMQMLREDLDPSLLESGEAQGTGKVAVLYFNGWLFEGYDDAKSALLSSILTSLRDHRTFGSKIKDQASSLLKKVNLMRGAKYLFTGAMVGGIAAATGGVGLAAMLPAVAAGALTGGREALPDAAKESVAGKADEAQDDALSDIRQFREEFASLLKKGDIETLVVLIDDLDRCSPDRIIDNLEAIKLFLNVPNTAFVIGADRRIIRQAVAWRYREALSTSRSGEPGDNDGADRLVEDYLEKLIQIPYRLPKLSPSEIETYLTLLFCERHLPEEQFQAICQKAVALKSKDRYRAFDQACAIEGLDTEFRTGPLLDALRIGARIANQITDVLMGNPRQVKRFLNAFFLRRRLADVARLEEVNDETLVKLMLLEYSSPKLFEGLFGALDGESGIIETLATLEAAANGVSGDRDEAELDLPSEWKSMKRWLTMEPHLSGVDLRDYMWVTRDRLGSTLSGTTMIPTVVRATLKLLLSDLGSAQGLTDAHKLNPQELSILTTQLASVAHRNPSNLSPFKALMNLGERYAESAEAYEGLFSRVPTKDLPPALSVEIERRSKGEGHLGAVCKRLMKKYQDDSSRFAKGFSFNKKKK